MCRPITVAREIGVEFGDMLILPMSNLLVMIGITGLSIVAVSWIATSRNVKDDTLMGLVVAAVLLGPLAIPLAFIPKRRGLRR